MSSSCVPPKGSSVSHDPSADSGHDHNGDTDSECGSLCTCTSSSSMTSIAASTDNLHHSTEGGNRSNETSVSQARHQQHSQGLGALPSATTAVDAAAQAMDNNGSPYFVVFVPPTMLPSRDNNCGNCQGRVSVQAVVKASLISALEFCPWVAGVIFIYYAFYLWGIGPGFSAFLLVMGGHAFIRFLRTGGQSKCLVSRLRRVPQNSTSNDATENEDDDADGGNEEGVGIDAPREPRNESPPPYEAAVVKPPPYDLYHHLTPTQPRCQFTQTEKCSSGDHFLTVPQLMVKKEQHLEVEDEDDDVFLPSYQDAIRLSFRSEKSLEAEYADINDGQS